VACGSRLPALGVQYVPWFLGIQEVGEKHGALGLAGVGGSRLCVYDDNVLTWWRCEPT
jgi:hypothetical protein